MTSKRRLVATLSLTMIFTIFAGVVSAHHSRAGYDNKKTVTLKGVVKEVNWRNPHVYVIFGVKDDRGAVFQWRGDLSSVSTMLGAGMAKDPLNPGDEFFVIGAPA